MALETALPCVVNDETVFKMLIFQAYWEIVKLISSQLGTVRKFQTEEFWNRRQLVNQGHVVSRVLY